MNGHFLKRVPITLVALTASLSIFAVTTDTKQLEQQMKQVRTETAAGTFGARTASARPEVDGAGAFFTIDALLWKANLGGTDYAQVMSRGRFEGDIGKTREDEEKNTVTSDSMSLETVDFDWDWGVKVGIGYNYEHDNWESNLLFTYFGSNESDKTQVAGASVIYPTNGRSDEPVEYSFASSQMKFVYDNLDLELARSFFVSQNLALKPHFGLKNTWLDIQKYNKYVGTQRVLSYIEDDHHRIFVNDLNRSGTLFYKSKSKFWGIGPTLGLNTKWYLCNGFGLFGDVSGALLWSYFQMREVTKETLSSASSEEGDIAVGSKNTTFTYSENTHRFVPTAQFAIGISYDCYMNDNKQHVNVSLGWETLHYWNAYKTWENVSMQGVTLNVRLDF